MKADELMTADELLHKYFDVLALEKLTTESYQLLQQYKSSVLNSIDKQEKMKAIQPLRNLSEQDTKALALLCIAFDFEAYEENLHHYIKENILLDILLRMLLSRLKIYNYNMNVNEKFILSLIAAFKPILEEGNSNEWLFRELIRIATEFRLNNNYYSEELCTKLRNFSDSLKNRYFQGSSLRTIKEQLNVFLLQRELMIKYFGLDENSYQFNQKIYQVLNDFYNELSRYELCHYQLSYSPSSKIINFNSVKQILLLPEQDFNQVVLLWTEFFSDIQNFEYLGYMMMPYSEYMINNLLIIFYKDKRILNKKSIIGLLDKFRPQISYRNKVLKSFIGVLESFKNKNGFDVVLLEKLKDGYKKYQACDCSQGDSQTRKDYAQIELRIKELLVSPVEDAPIVLPFDDKIGQRFEFYQLNKGELHSAMWPTLISADIDKMSINQQQAWAKLWAYAVTADGGSPSKKWLTQGQALIQNTEDFAAIAQKWLDCILDDIKHNDVDLSNAFSENNKQAVKGFIWLCSCANSDIFASVLGGLANFGYSKAYGVGARAPAVANAALYTLGQIGAQGVVQLSKLRSKVKFKTGLKLIEKALTEAATRQGISADDLEELSVPKMGFNQNYSKTVDWSSEYTASIMLTGSKKVEIQWFNKSNHQALKNIPSSIKTDYRSQFKELQKQLADIQDIITGQTKRFEDSYLAKRQWKFIDWQQRLIQHDLLSWLATRLIWGFEHNGQTQHGFYLFGQLVNAQNQPIQVDEQSTVSLWHPVYSTVEEVQQWRTLISQQQIIQPFKQAYREVYLITPAEIETGNYSNRFAGHVLKQHQFAALAKDRAWGYKLQGSFGDIENHTGKFIPQWQMGVRLDFDDKQENRPLTESGLYQYMITEKVMFSEKGVRINLINVPAIIFSEMMRDIDLFVGVTSIGTEATTDLYANNPYTDYIDAFSKAELSARALVRQEVLANIISKLAIAPRCSFDNKHLIVKGDIRTYKIHLGSSNILMEPNDQYLCIVPSSKQKQASTEGLYLPFEGDLMLSVILSKALLLAADKKIKDQSILAQINRP